MKFIALLSLSLLTFGSFAQDRSICPDAEGAVNHPLIEKYKNSCIVAYNETKFDQVTFPASQITSSEGAPKEVTEEGKVTSILYGIRNIEAATTLEVQRNYEQALKNGGFEIVFSAFGKKNISANRSITNVYEMYGVDVLGAYKHVKYKSYFRFSLSPHNANINNDDAYFLAKGKHNGKIYTLAIYIHYNRSSWEGLTDNIFVSAIIVEKEDMETGQVSTASIEEKIKNEGKEVFHNILFDFGSANLTAESFTTVAVLADYLKANASQKYYIVGHTDNVGSLVANQTLSEKRAKAVVTALVSKYGVSASQISAHGVGQLSPLSANETEEGRTLNRRVEIVLQ